MEQLAESQIKMDVAQDNALKVQSNATVSRPFILKETKEEETSIKELGLKSVFDFTIALIILLLISPVMLLVALAIRLESRGPIFYLQPRHGLNQQIFTIFKFRSMYADQCVKNGGGKQASSDDSRVTRVGRFIRKTSIDELPQLFNVLQGDMSLIGPRPHAVDHNFYYQQHIENYGKRHNVKPGITGWAQVKGYRGQTKAIDDMRHRVSYDLEYVEKMSPGLDLKILFLTVRELVKPRNAH